MLVLYCNVTSESHMILSIIICYFTFTEHHDCCFSDTLLNCLHLNSYNVHLPPNILHLAFIYARNQTWKDSWTVSLSLRLSQCRCRLQVNDAGDDSPGQASPLPPPLSRYILPRFNISGWISAACFELHRPTQLAQAVAYTHNGKCHLCNTVNSN